MKYVYEFTNKRKLTKAEFLKWFQKKVLYTIRKFEMVRNGDVICYKNSGNFRDAVLEDILKMFAEKADVRLVKLFSPTQFAIPLVHHQPIPREIAHPPPSNFLSPLFINNYLNPKTNYYHKIAHHINKIKPIKIAISSTTDTEADKLIHILVKGNAKNMKELAPVCKKTIKPLYLFLDEEVLLYANLKKLKFRKMKEKKDEISVFIDELEKKHPEIKRAVVKGYLELFP